MTSHRPPTRTSADRTRPRVWGPEALGHALAGEDAPQGYMDCGADDMALTSRPQVYRHVLAGQVDSIRTGGVAACVRVNGAVLADHDPGVHVAVVGASGVREGGGVRVVVRADVREDAGGVVLVVVAHRQHAPTRRDGAERRKKPATVSATEVAARATGWRSWGRVRVGWFMASRPCRGVHAPGCSSTAGAFSSDRSGPTPLSEIDWGRGCQVRCEHEGRHLRPGLKGSPTTGAVR